MEDPKKIKVTFAPGCFDSFEGTQEELDEFVSEIMKMFEDPEKMMAKSIPLDIDSLEDDELAQLAHKLLSPEEIDELISQGMPNLGHKRTLQ